MDQAAIAALAVKAGLSAARAETASAIAMAESGGNPDSHNSKPPDDSYGLWQINMLSALGPSRRAIYGLKANTDLFDPATNARVMSAISQQGQNFGPWTTYTSGAYKKFLGTAGVAAAAGAAAGAGSSDGSSGVLGDAMSLATFTARSSEALVRATRWVSSEKNWLRVGYVALGGVAVLLGLVSVIKTSEAGNAVIRTTTKVAKKAATAAAAA